MSIDLCPIANEIHLEWTDGWIVAKCRRGHRARRTRRAEVGPGDSVGVDG